MVLLVIIAYLIGAIPFGYLIARAKGVDLFQAGSGNIGASNAGRVLGRKYGVLVFLLDFAKGAVPVALAPVFAARLPSEFGPRGLPVDLLRVATALAAFLGHLFPVFLGFRGGKGVATGAGTVCVLVPGPAAVALLIWLATVVSERMISFASLTAVTALCVARVVAAPKTDEALILTAYCIVGAAIVFIKHRANLRRLLRGDENRIEATPMIEFLQRAVHLLALGIWLGSAFFFNFLAAPKIFETFKQVAVSEPNDRTAYIDINSQLDDGRKKQLGNALAGAAVGPLFPIFFALSGICGAAALITACGWYSMPGKVNRWRVYVIGLAVALVAISWPISERVTELRLVPARFSPDPDVSGAAIAEFARWHLWSLGLSFLTAILVLAAMILAAKMPETSRREVNN